METKQLLEQCKSTYGEYRCELPPGHKRKHQSTGPDYEWFVTWSDAAANDKKSSSQSA
jgi:hypothetical protein